MDIITRKQAQEQGLTRYFTGKPCKHGHIAERQTSKGVCVECHKVCRDERQASGKIRAYYAEKMATDSAFRQRKRNDAKKHYHEVMKHDKARMRRHYDRIATYQQNNRETCNRAQRAHRERNPGYDRPYVVARRAKIKHSELTPQEQRQVKAIYDLRAALTKTTQVEFHVDHRVPLSKGGTHHPSNLWVIPAEENLRKGAKLVA